MTRDPNTKERVDGAPPEPSDGASRPRLKDVAYETIRDRIVDGVYAPGTFLSERRVAEELGMSKTPVHSAIDRLEAEGFLLVSPQQGIVVAELSIDEIVDHFEIRAALESYVARGLAGRLERAQCELVEANLAAQLRSADDRDLLDYRILDGEFHLLLCGFFGNREIERVMWRQRDKLHRIITRVVRQHEGRMHSSYEEHRAIYEALRAGDADDAVRRLEEHLAWGRRALVAR